MEGEATRTRKIRIYPNQEQVKLFDKCFYTHRYFYNKAVAYTKKHRTTSFITIRDNLLIGNSKLSNKWMAQVPYDTRQLAVKSFTAAYKSALALLKKGHIKHFELKFLTKKDRSDVFYVNKRALSANFKIFSRKLSDPLRLRKKARDQLKKYCKAYKKTTLSDGDFPIIRDSAGRYYMCLVQKITPQSKNIDSLDNIVALDPGVRTFQTYFSQREFGTIGDNANKDLRKINEKIDKLSQITAKSRKKYKLRRRIRLSRSKITNKVNDLHWKAAAFLTRRYKVIFLPTFPTQKIAKKNPNHKTNREMYNLAHYRFKMRLKYKASLNDCQVIDCCESYTSKTCTNCGKINNVGAKKIYKCSSCPCHIDRDLNGARNIFIRCLTKHYS